MKKLKKIIIMTILVTMFSYTLTGCKTNLAKIQDGLDKDDYIEALNQIGRIRNDDDKSKVIDIVNEKVQKIKEQFLNGQIDGTLAISNIQKFKNINGVEENVKKTVEEINTLMISQKGFADGQRGEKEKDYAIALEGYSNVIESDTENYKIAQAKLKELRNTVEASALATVESTKIHTNNTSNKSMYPDQMQVMILNKSQKTIKKFTVGILGYDSNGNPLKIKSQQNDYKEYEFIGFGENINISPGELWGDQYGWSLAMNHNLKKILSCIKTLEFSDGSTWTNPLYNIWLNEHKEKTLTNN